MHPADRSLDRFHPHNDPAESRERRGTSRMPYPLSGPGRHPGAPGPGAPPRRAPAPPGGAAGAGRQLPREGERDAETCERGRPKRDRIGCFGSRP